MNQSQLTAYFLDKLGATEETPFGPDVLVYKVRGKMYALLAYHEGQLRINLKCAPDKALMLRDVFDAVIPGYHMNKKHWNTVIIDDSIPEPELLGMIDDSYDLVVKGLKKSEREALGKSND